MGRKKIIAITAAAAGIAIGAVLTAPAGIQADTGTIYAGEIPSNVSVKAYSLTGITYDISEKDTSCASDGKTFGVDASIGPFSWHEDIPVVQVSEIETSYDKTYEKDRTDADKVTAVAVFTDGRKKDVSDSVEIEGEGRTIEGKTDITADTEYGKTDVEINPVMVKEVSASYRGTVRYGEVPDRKNVDVSVTFEDGKTIVPENWSCTPSALTAGNTSMKVATEYGDSEIRFDPVRYESASVKEDRFMAGDKADIRTVTLTYEDGTSKEVPAEYAGLDTGSMPEVEAGENTIPVTADGQELALTVYGVETLPVEKEVIDTEGEKDEDIVKSDARYSRVISAVSDDPEGLLTAKNFLASLYEAPDNPDGLAGSAYTDGDLAAFAKKHGLDVPEDLNEEIKLGDAVSWLYSMYGEDPDDTSGYTAVPVGKDDERYPAFIWAESLGLINKDEAEDFDADKGISDMEFMRLQYYRYNPRKYKKPEPVVSADTVGSYRPFSYQTAPGTYMNMEVLDIKDASGLTVDLFLERLKGVTDFVRENGYRYGSSNSAPPCTDGLISCDRLVASALYSCGMTDMPAGGIACNTFDGWLNAHGFVRSTDWKDAKRGSIMLVAHKGENGCGHMYVMASDPDASHNADRYDCGSNGYIQSVQPIHMPGYWYRTDWFIIYNIP